MIAIAVACVSLTVLLIQLVKRKRGQLGRWRIPLRLALYLSAGWMIYLALTAHLH
jgi:hypothetical protein